MSNDLVRRIAVTASAVLCAVATAFGVGALGGTEVSEAAGGALAADATLIAPGSGAFGIWSVIYLGLAGYVVWQWLPVSATARARAVGWWAAASMLLNGAWLLTIQLGWLWASVAVILALAVVLKVVLARLTAHRPAGRAELVVVDGTFGLYLGWVAVATCANLAAALVAAGMPPTGLLAEAITIFILIAVLVLAAVYARSYGARFAIAAAMAWGVGWIAVARLTGEPSAPSVGVTAVAVAVVILVVTVLMRAALRRTRSGTGSPPA
ncbi:tryptophan-rich sensory protein [Ruania halotolerans]|uniref:tryptophan-rich sensory protein n=1 Tax=Ruania halotolerans TaxID=2897773 RepID=UPI001E5A8E08|nr:tryptophan-rich sensory protein [Ruania halotolerans]UFU06552.1 tryptophan-rich sensory protein [Ruania halotolerans]